MTRRLLALLGFGILALLCAAFVHLNNARVSIDFFFGTVQVGVGAALIGALVLGWALAGVAALSLAARAARARRRLRHELKLVQAEVRTLRATAPGHAP
jgi:uncharacterized integral membrane protein